MDLLGKVNNGILISLVLFKEFWTEEGGYLTTYSGS